MKDKIQFIKKFFMTNPTTPQKLGERILLLFSAPDANNYFEYESVRRQFADYDLAVVNYMPIVSEDKMHEYKPKYYIVADPGFYSNDYRGKGTINTEKKKLEDALNRVDWDCTLITSVLNEFCIDNPKISVITLNCFSSNYNVLTRGLYRRNYIGPKSNNVSQAAMYFAITFGYKNVAIIGCPYKHLEYYMHPDGLHVYDHMHYYDDTRGMWIESYDSLKKYKYGYAVNYHKRATESAYTLYYISEYAKDMKVDMVNYSEENMITTMRAGSLDKTQSDKE